MEERKEDGTYRCGDICASDSFNWSIKVVECLAFDDLGANFTTDTKGWKTAFDCDESNGC
jgi:hypothetical protein